jgi:hypothetical protein
MAVTAEIARITDEFERAFEGDCWHGPPLLAVLAEVTARQAAARHPQLVHSIWALVKHLTAWIEVVRLRITENRAIEVPLAGDFPIVTDTSEAAWEASLADLGRQHQELIKVVVGLSPSKLDEIVPGKNYPVAVMLHGTSQHYAYHAGQIALLKKLIMTD